MHLFSFRKLFCDLYILHSIPAVIELSNVQKIRFKVSLTDLSRLETDGVFMEATGSEEAVQHDLNRLALPRAALQ